MDDVKIQLDMIQIIEELPKYEQAARQCDDLYDLFENVLDVAVIVNR